MVRMVRIDTSGLRGMMERLNELPKAEIPKAYVSAINRTLDHMYTNTAREVKDVYNVKVSEIKNSTTKRKASGRRTSAWLIIRSRRFTLGRFLPGGLGSKSKRTRVKIKKAGGYLPVGGSPKPFLQRLKGNTHIMRRVGQKRYPVDVLRTLSPTQMVENEKVLDKVRPAAQEMAIKRLNHEIDRRLRRIAKKGGGG
jgi:hypothetical protein